MRLEIDAGNSFIKWRLSAQGQEVSRGRLAKAAFTPTQLAAVVGAVPDAVWVASVLGAAFEQQLSQWCRQHWQLAPCYARTQASCAGVRNSYQQPERMGVDRWLAMVAAFSRRRQCGPGGLVVVDCGSAITIDYLDQNGQHQGGYIIPGLTTMQRSLLRHTAQIRYEAAPLKVSLKPGNNTADAVTQGALFALHALAQRLAQDVGAGEMLITGGDGELFQRFAGVGEYSPDLVLDGLEKVCCDA